MALSDEQHADAYARERDRMVDALRRAGIRDERVLAAMRRVPRERFMPQHDAVVAYGDHAVAIGEGQTISQPWIVARMTELLALAPEHRVLEVGTGSGYQAAVIAELAAHVFTVERREALAAAAEARLAELGYANVTVVVADGSEGYPPAAPYDAIVVTAAAPAISEVLAAQCRPSGRVVAPVGDEEMQELVVRYGDGRIERGASVRFVPLIGTAGFRERA